MRKNLYGGIEQRRACDPTGVERGELEDEPPTERMTQERRSSHADVVKCLEDVVHVSRNRPRRLPVGEAVTAQIGCEHVEAPREALLGELAPPSSVRVDPVEADDRRRVRLAPFVNVQKHYARRVGSSSRQSPTRLTSAALRIGAPRLSLIAAITFAFTKPVNSSNPPATPTATSRRGATGRP